jgi:hypothetical protein
MWLPLASGKNVEVHYSVTVTGASVTLTLRAANTARDGSAVALSATFQSTPSIRPSTPSAQNVRLSPQLAAGADCQASTEFTLLGDAANGLMTTLHVPCTTHVTAESLLGPDTYTLPGVLNIPPTATLTPHKVDEQGFALLLGKSSSRWAAGSVKVPFGSTSKAKSVLKGVGSFLRAHVVEGEATKAASMCAKTPSGGIVCVLVKISEAKSQAGVDVKCLCGTKAESQAMVEGIVGALGELSL